ncbi:MAG: hypothetical protein J1F18_04955 [Lachnospiraceae bacterium]|nr:hypothetical protein [Lachnospiraceae bacterium]
MKRFKKLAAVTMAATMLLGSSLMVSAAGPSGGDTGSGSFEGYVEETSVFSASVPTNAANVFNFFVDPNGLLEKTEYKRLAGKTADDFETGSTLFFTRTPSDTVKEFGKDSEKVTAKNMSSYDVNIEVSASITGIDGITMADSDTIGADVEDPTLYLAIVSGSKTVAVKADEGGLLSGEIAGTPGNFEIQYNTEKGKYEYAQKATDQLSDWAEYDFYLTGACGGNWTDEQAEATPTVELTWKISDPNANEAPSIEKAAYAMIAGTAVKIPVDLGAGELGATGIKKITYEKSGTARDLEATNYTFANGILTIKASYVDSLLNAGISREFIITFNDAARTQVTFALRALAAPSIAATTYTMTAGTAVKVPVDLGAGDLAATGISKITYEKSGTERDLEATNYTFANGILTIEASYVDSLLSASISSREFTITFDDAAKTTVSFTLTK